MLTFSLLGPVQAWRDGTELDLGSPQQRTTLAMLLLREGAVVTLDELIAGMWGDEPPRSAVTTIRTYVSRLRNVLGAAHLSSVGGGYALTVDADALDVVRFRRLAAKGSAACRRGDWRTAAGALAEALASCHGQPLAGALGLYAQGQRTRLRQLIVTARVDLASAQVGLGRHREVLPEITAMATEFPLWEEVQALYMTALYGCGRVADALHHYRRARQMLIEDLGMEPGARMRDIHQRILAGDPSLVSQPALAPVVAMRRPDRRSRHHRVHTARLRLARVTAA